MRAAHSTLAIALLVAAGDVAHACPPPPPETPESRAAWERRLQAYKDHAREAAGIVYGVMEDGVDYDSVERDPDRVGTLHILHVYRGRFRRGQRIRMRPGGLPLSYCPMPPMSVPAGAYGVVILDHAGNDEPVRHNGFLLADMIRTFIAEGIIESAQQDRAGRPAAGDPQP